MTKANTFTARERQRHTVYKKSRLRELPSVKVGRALRFDVRALERYVDQHSIQTID